MEAWCLLYLSNPVSLIPHQIKYISSLLSYYYIVWFFCSPVQSFFARNIFSSLMTSQTLLAAKVRFLLNSTNKNVVGTLYNDPQHPHLLVFSLLCNLIPLSRYIMTYFYWIQCGRGDRVYLRFVTKQLWLLLGCSPAYLLWGKPVAIPWAALQRGPHTKYVANSQRGPEACQGPHITEPGSGCFLRRALRWFDCSLACGPE